MHPKQKLNEMNGATPAEQAHWSRVQAGLLSGFNFWGKPKVNPDLVEKLSAELADKAARSFRERFVEVNRTNSKRTGK